MPEIQEIAPILIEEIDSSFTEGGIHSVYGPDLNENLLENDKSLSLAEHSKRIQTQLKTVQDPVLMTQYCVNIYEHELPVIGTYVDERIVPGFSYRVRRLDGVADYLWGGKSRSLVSIGMGYGKRITFRGENRLDQSEYYFYSDTEAQGFAFIPTVPLDVPAKFEACDTLNRPCAEVIIRDVQDLQTELGINQSEQTIDKSFYIHFTCDIHLSTSQPNYPLSAHIFGAELSGIATMRRIGGARNKAELLNIAAVRLPSIPGQFQLHRI